MRVVDNRIDPYESTRDPREKKARQIIFRLSVSPRTCDLFYNARDGLRARYWQSPQEGHAANREILNLLIPRLLRVVRQSPPRVAKPQSTSQMTIDDIEISLRAWSAKIWPCEFDPNGIRTMPYEGLPQLDVARWRTKELETGDPRWRWTPCDRDLEVKGALIALDGGECVPASKVRRAEDINETGFT